MIPDRLYQSNIRGSALVTVLVCLIFVSVLMIAFMVSMRTQVQISRSGSDSNDARTLADTAVNIVVSQIREATSLAGQQGLAWASQPGMIRLYSGSGAAGFFKLYSSDSMTGTGAFNPFVAAESIPASWTNSPSIFTDLNSPVSGVYPILNPAAIDPSPGAAGTGASSMAVDEFTINSAPTGGGNVLPMPVRWLYLLADGTIHSPSAASSGERAVVPAATTSNPIIGRVAFWADDETCKVNINTASIGLASTNIASSQPYGTLDYSSFWDAPHFSTRDDYNFGNAQPAQGEYQRYPGHPATVALNAVFSSTTASQISQLFAIAPRYASGGSEGGSIKFNSASWINRATLADRLYSTVDEIIFQVPSGTANRTLNPGLTKEKIQAASFFLTASSRAPELNLFGQPRVSIWPADTSVTNAASAKSTAIDRLFAFCATIGKGSAARPFYFSRSSAVNALTDIAIPRNLRLLEYLDQLTGKNIPGFGGDYKTKYTEPESRQILTEIFDYIRTINTQDPLLSTANTYATYPTAGWGFGKSQVVPSLHATWSTQGFGSFWRPIEVGINIVGLGDGPLSASPGPVAPGIPIPDVQINQLVVQHDADITQRQIDPSWSGTGVPPAGWMPPNDSRAIQAFLTISFLNPAHSRIDGSCRMWMKVTGLDGLSVAGSPSTPATTRALGFPSSASMLVGANNAGDDIGTVAWFGYLPINALTNAGGFLRTLGNASGENNFPFFSKIVSIPAGRNQTAMSFSGGTITIELYDISAGPTQLLNPATLPAGANKVQTITITFPGAANLPIPGLTKYPLIGSGLLQSNSMVAPTLDGYQRVISADRWNLPRKQSSEWGGFNGRYGRTLIDTEGVADQAGRTSSDVLQSMILSNAWSDARLLAVSSVPEEAFSPHPSYGTARLANDLRMGDANPLPSNSGTFGKLVNGVTYNSSAFNPASASYHPYHRNPMVPASFPGVNTWDWDNGLGNYPDGPWINKADEGNLMANTAQTPYFNTALVVTPGLTFFSPNRQISSPGTFGSLSTGVSRHLPWQTLLFRPGPTGHPGIASPGDARMMDLFWMPVVEPYAISEPFSTAGKINLNQQLVPFTYINRFTGLRAAMMSEKVAQVRKSDSLLYKTIFPDNPAITTPSRLPINLSESNGTLKQLADKFASGEIYKSATEICDLYLVPQGYTWPAFQGQWYGDDFALVGDNVREKPYANLYGKLTTKSNSFLVHYRVQALRQPVQNLGVDPTIFDPTRGDKVVAEQRGSALVERYLDPSDSRFASGAPASFFDNPGANLSGFSLESYYRTRVYNSKVFNP